MPCIIKNLIESGLHVRTISEEFNQSHDFMKLVLDIHREYHSKLNDKKQELDDHWFDDVDQEILYLHLTFPIPCISESCIKIKINLNFHFHTSLWCPERFCEGLKSLKLIFSLRLGSGQEALSIPHITSLKKIKMSSQENLREVLTWKKQQKFNEARLK